MGFQCHQFKIKLLSNCLVMKRCTFREMSLTCSPPSQTSWHSKVGTTAHLYIQRWAPLHSVIIKGGHHCTVLDSKVGTTAQFYIQRWAKTSVIKIRISPRKRMFEQNLSSLFIRCPGGFDSWREKNCQKY